jgi:hypothetical protein
MNLRKFEYQKAEYVKAFKILEYIFVARTTSPNYFLLDSGMPNMPFAMAVPDSVRNPTDAIGKYFIMYDDGDHDIVDKISFELEFMPRT